jgi:transcriptional regulator with XRE-family HTH domain
MDIEWGKRIASARDRRGLTQGALAKMINVAQQTLAGYETGASEPGLAVFVRLAAATGTTPEWLAFGVGEGPVSD